jgi:serine/threonine protein kinase
VVRTADDRTEELEQPTRDARSSGSGDGPGGPGLVLDRYRLIRRLGAGGFGVVWMAHDERLDRLVAIKRIATHDAAAGTRAQREAKAAARLAHPGIVALYESGRDEGAV